MLDLYINTQGKGNVQVKKMECDICKVKTEEGNCLLHSVKVRGRMTTDALFSMFTVCTVCISRFSVITADIVIFSVA